MQMQPDRVQALLSRLQDRSPKPTDVEAAVRQMQLPATMTTMTIDDNLTIDNNVRDNEDCS
jgi:hypothetical protein